MLADCSWQCDPHAAAELGALSPGPRIHEQGQWLLFKTTVGES